MNKIKAYKVFNSDWKCRDFQFEVGKTYKHDGEIKICKSGFHACTKLIDCFSYYGFDSANKVAEVEILGKSKTHGEDSKIVTDKIKIVKELSWHEALDLVNTGKNNTGHRNSGNRNSGDSNSGNRNSGHSNSGNRNSGHSNSGDWNSGDWNSGNSNSGHSNSGYWNSGRWNSGRWNSGNSNSGDWNSCNQETGYFNSKQSEFINVFNKPCRREDWENARKPDFIYFEMTKVIDDKLIAYTYKEAWSRAFAKATKQDIVLLKALPNFDVDVFKEISGIDLRDKEEGK